MKTARAAVAAAALACSTPLCAEDFSVDRGWEIGGRVWLSTGKTQWSHNASGVQPLFGNPTSTLTYERLNATSLELYGAKRWRPGFFITGNAGIGRIYGGNLNDQDFAAGQVKFSETNSSINEGTLGYLTVDGGFNFIRGYRTSLGVFGGFNYWTESVDAMGASSVVPPGAPGISSGTKVITNEVRWYSLRVGLAGRTQIGEKFNLSGIIAAVPATVLRNDDSHYLRRDLGSTPNITMDGTGYGIQLDGEARYSLFKSTDIGLGVRYWKLKATGDIHFAGGSALPLTDFQSTRYGATVSVITRF